VRSRELGYSPVLGTQWHTRPVRVRFLSRTNSGHLTFLLNKISAGSSLLNSFFFNLCAHIMRDTERRTNKGQTPRQIKTDAPTKAKKKMDAKLMPTVTLFLSPALSNGRWLQVSLRQVNGGHLRRISRRRGWRMRGQRREGFRRRGRCWRIGCRFGRRRRGAAEELRHVSDVLSPPPMIKERAERYKGIDRFFPLALSEQNKLKKTFRGEVISASQNWLASSDRFCEMS
jgi:hypothetical protein